VNIELFIIKAELIQNGMAWIKISPTILLEVACFFGLSAFSCLVYIGTFLEFNKSHSARRLAIAKQLSSFIGEITIAESEEELNFILEQPDVAAKIKKITRSKDGRIVLIRELMNMHKSVLGAAAANIRWLYIYLNLQEDAVKRLRSSIWYIKAGALQELAEMRQEKFVVNIYRETNNKNIFIRREAQLALVKLTGFEGLRFLNIARHPITEWQQIRLLDHLSLQKGAKWENLKKWLQSENESVISFALRLIEKYQLYEFHDATLLCMEHRSSLVRLQALKTLKEIAQAQTAFYLEHAFLVSPYNEQLIILGIIGNIGSKNQISFLSSLIQYDDLVIRHKAEQTIRQINGSNEDFHNIAVDSSTTTVKDSYKKERVL
jgi:hypothetical protein